MGRRCSRFRSALLCSFPKRIYSQGSERSAKEGDRKLGIGEMGKESDSPCFCFRVGNYYCCAVPDSFVFRALFCVTYHTSVCSSSSCKCLESDYVIRTIIVWYAKCGRSTNKKGKVLEGRD